MKTTNILAANMGLMHGINDCTAGFILGSLATLHPDPVAVSWWILIYNALAFGGQAPLAIFADKFSQGKLLFTLGIVCNLSGLLLAITSPLLAVVFLGIGSALVHIVGGSVCLQASPGKASAAGVFTAPGVLGLAFGGLMAFTGVSLVWPLVFATAIVALAALSLTWPSTAKVNTVASSSSIQLDRHDWIMILLLLAIAMRSAIWNTFQLINQGDYHLLLLLAAAAMGGKLVGGYLADRVGWRNYALGALLLAAPLLTFGGRKPVLLAIGVGLLQSVTPLALAAMHRSLPYRPALATGLTLGLAIVVGGIPLLIGWDWFSNPLSLLVAMPLLAAAYFGLLKWQEEQSKRISIDAQPVQHREQAGG